MDRTGRGPAPDLPSGTVTLLSLPGPRQPQTPESLSHYEAVRLFMDRAAQVQTPFAVTNQNAPALASRCLRLDGIPLAIDLAAARVRSLTLAEIHARLDQRFRLLTGGSRTALPRRQTLRLLIDWSYDLLNGAEQALLCRLSVFPAGWALEAAEAVCAGEPVHDSEILDLLPSLCDKSLVLFEPAGPSMRYRLGRGPHAGAAASHRAGPGSAGRLIPLREPPPPCGRRPTLSGASSLSPAG
ncbi:MAG: hypothetical protein FJX77_04890 [Armatimonadetes bacterium]|nr:hypothetical protein [Armatimonadota bacterium]